MVIAIIRAESTDDLGSSPNVAKCPESRDFFRRQLGVTRLWQHLGLGMLQDPPLEPSSELGNDVWAPLGQIV